MFKGSKLWPKKRVRRLAEEVEAYIKYKRKPENGGHDTRFPDPQKAGCGVCVTMREAERFLYHLKNEGVTPMKDEI